MKVDLCQFCKYGRAYGDEIKCVIYKEKNQKYNDAFNNPWSKKDIPECKDYDLDDFMKEEIQKEECKKNEYNQKKSICPILGNFCNTDGDCNKCINEEEEFQKYLCELECKNINGKI